MSSHKHFIQDRSALLLVSLNTFLALAAIVLVALKLDSSKGTVNYIVSFRSSLGFDGYTQGTAWDVVSLWLQLFLSLLSEWRCPTALTKLSGNSRSLFWRSPYHS
ncbi:hypothetical protein IPL68_03925 [Candidatus Saccharibacteria bacterium]|nr:MAG: hypothetical protein IPL68_03925 [Candidatus Saccharibacteria bacterium]